ncbi:hypothetical protein [Mesorhizobium sp. YM1C-6-2]|uniref:hypothetical protein n=1 Tax=Mesorhizobium sp. YM1C-6-2 TaxID=1827501 RepID=UPI0011C3A316|nr:hypothetical protein [Mesorhizobium sp. YM1C-6-2]
MVELLQKSTDIVRGFYQREAEVDARLAAKPLDSPWEPIAPNPFTDGKTELRDSLDALLADRTIRTFHYTRLADDEVERLMEVGIELSDTAPMRRRLNARVAAGDFSPEQADEIFQASALHSEAYGKRCGMFWTCGLPYPSDCPGVARLIAMWGGEAAYWTLQDHKVYGPLLRGVGAARIVEVAVPLDSATHFGGASGVVVDAYAKSLGFEREISGLDVCCKDPMPPSSILAIHTKGDGTFELVGRGYP